MKKALCVLLFLGLPAGAFAFRAGGVALGGTTAAGVSTTTGTFSGPILTRLDAAQNCSSGSLGIYGNGTTFHAPITGLAFPDAGSSGSGVEFCHDGAMVAYTTESSGAKSFFIGQQGSATNPSLGLYDLSMGLFRPGANKMGFTVNGTETMRLTTTGLKIGAAADPSSALDVNGTVTATTFSGSGASLTSVPATSLSAGAVPNNVTISTPNVASGSSLLDRNLSITVDGAGSAITTGAKKIYLRVPASMTLQSWEIVADSSGSVKVDVYKSTTTSIFTNGGFPPTVSIVGSSTPTVTTATISSGTTSGWTTALTKGDYLELNVLSDSVITRFILTLVGVLN